MESDFFDELGANSLLMAGFAGRMRAAYLPAPSMKEIYQHPTIRSLARSLADRRTATSAEETWSEPEMPVPVGTRTTGFPGRSRCSRSSSTPWWRRSGSNAGISWISAAHGTLEAYVRTVAVGAGALLLTGLLPIAAKWALIGRFKPARIRVWSLRYVRFWIVKTLLVTNPVAHLLVGSPLYALYLRALGAKVGVPNAAAQPASAGQHRPHLRRLGRGGPTRKSS